ncbi:MAG: hypothetical protein C4518_07705 [Desulfobacteraceae bacterium]|nr:MAG: hypothetical protein C4518_07705 [Desulfobacteraceae bacterium]
MKKIAKLESHIMQKIYYPHQPNMLFLIIMISISCFLSVWLFLKWQASGNWLVLIPAVFFVILFIFFSRPLIEWRQIDIEDGCITVFKRFCKPLKFKISDSLYQIVLKNEDIRSFRFRVNDKRVQISPVTYKEGTEMTEKIVAYMKKHKMVVEFVSI